MESELQPYQFLQTDYNKKAFTLTNDKTTAKNIRYVRYKASGGDFKWWDIDSHDCAYLSMTRPIGRDHRLILKILGSAGSLGFETDVHLYFTTCDTASLLANDKHLIEFCGAGRCHGQRVTKKKAINTGSQVIITRTTDNRIEIVVIDASGGSSTEHVTTDEPVVPVISFRKIYQYIEILPDEAGLRSQIHALKAAAIVISNASGGLRTEFWDVEIAAEVPVVPVVLVCKSWQNIQILPDETGLQSVLSQIVAFKAIAQQKRHDILTAIGADWNDLRSDVQSTTNKLDQQINQLMSDSCI